jgi:hypothetical protein
VEGAGTACEDAAVETKLIKVNVYCWCVDPYSSSSGFLSLTYVEVPLEERCWMSYSRMSAACCAALRRGLWPE